MNNAAYKVNDLVRHIQTWGSLLTYNLMVGGEQIVRQFTYSVIPLSHVKVCISIKDM